MGKTIIGVTIGDVAGIGPEIALKAILNKKMYDKTNIALIGDPKLLQFMIDKEGYNLKIFLSKTLRNADYSWGNVVLYPVDNINMEKFAFGITSAMCGKAAYDYIATSIELASLGEIDAVATAPINKESLHLGNVPYIGHTEIFAKLTNTDDPLTMFEIDNLRVFFLSRHVSLRKAIDLVKKERIIDYVKRSVVALKKIGVEGTIAVAGLNPHSGENGLFGKEEVDEIIPAINELVNEGYKVVGPIPADSVFALGLTGRWSAVLSLYHDQGHIATKTYDFERTIAITNGMPILRTSVDHGTAFDIAGKNMANEISMVEAISLASKYAPFFTK